MRRTLAILVELGEAALDHASLLILEAFGAGHCVVGGRLALDCWWQRGLPASGVMHDRVGRVARLRAIHAVDGTTLFCECTASGGRPPSLKLPDSTRTDANCGWEMSRRVGKMTDRLLASRSTSDPSTQPSPKPTPQASDSPPYGLLPRAASLGIPS
jgi:hypothetical protein